MKFGVFISVRYKCPRCNNEDVQMIDGAWKTATVQYWAPEHDYFFAAIAPMNSPNVTVNTSNANELGP